MKISYNWLQKHIEESLPDPKELAEVITFHAFEIEGIEDGDNDTILNIDVLPNRAGDCLSHYGIAREIAGLLKLSLKKENYEVQTTHSSVPVEIQSELCRRYVAIEIQGVTVGPSPEWLVTALTSIGQRSINNVVDITNYILHDLGQPVHAFDKEKIDGGIVIRLAKEGETIITLSDEEKTLKATDLLIADYLGPLAIAGVKGGKTSEVSEVTKNIVIEIANFDSVSTRKTSRSLNLLTDAAKRFENNLQPKAVEEAIGMTISLITSIAGGEVIGINDIYPSPLPNRTMHFTIKDIAKLLGSFVTPEVVKEIFDQYKYSYTLQDKDTFTLEIPWYRNDLQGSHDIAEEIVRVFGYEKLQPLPLPFSPLPQSNAVFDATTAVRNYLTQKGFSEIYTYTFRKKGEVYVAYGPKDKSALRTSLSEGMQEAYERNRLNAPLLGLKEIKLFEIGTVFIGGKEVIHVCTNDKGVVQELSLEQYIIDNSITTEPYLAYTKNMQAFKPWSPFPFITRDIAVWVMDENAIVTLEEIATDFAGKYCVRAPQLFDTFKKDGKTSVAYRFVFQSHEKTLTDEEVSDIFKELIKEIKKSNLFEIR